MRVDNIKQTGAAFLMAQQQNEREKASRTLVAKIAERLRNEILQGVFPPGTALREVPLSQHFGTSRQSLREALRSLADLGLVELRSRQGAVVPKLTPARTREIFTLRAVLEPFAVRAAMVEGRIKDAERNRIDEAFQHMRRCAEENDGPRLIEADMAFHWALCAPCDHRMLLELLERLQSATRLSFVHMKVYGSDAEGEVETHTPILHAVHARDAEGAAGALHDHIIQNGERLLMKLLA